MTAELLARNRARAEPAMRTAAAQVGAVLLPVSPQALRPIAVCTNATGPITPMLEGMTRETKCKSWRSADGRTFRIMDSQGIPRIAISVTDYASSYARLARRGNEFVVLEPRITTRTVDEATNCMCDGMPRPLIHIWYGFVVDDAPAVSVERLEVPVTSDVIEWSCKSRGV